MLEAEEFLSFLLNDGFKFLVTLLVMAGVKWLGGRLKETVQFLAGLGPTIEGFTGSINQLSESFSAFTTELSSVKARLDIIEGNIIGSNLRVEKAVKGEIDAGKD